MQTFLPLPDFAETAAVLDRQRLGKQRVENLQILKAMLDPTYGWQNHPAVRMWRGYEFEFWRYHQAICDEWVGRGYKDTCREKFNVVLRELRPYFDPAEMTPPPWLGDPTFHLAHRSKLIAKLPAHYRPLWPEIRDDLEYVWPVQ